MLNRYIVYERYEYWGPNGKNWTSWFRAFKSPFAKTEDEAKLALKEMKKHASEIDKHSKLKREFEIRLTDLETLPKPNIRYNKKGRPSKKEIEQQQYEYDNYWELFIEEYDRQN